jgi:hypothetical protein
VCVYILALVIQDAKRMRRIILSSVACSALPYFSTLRRKRHDSRKKVFERKECFDFLYNFETFLILRRIRPDMHRCSCKIPVIFLRFKSNFNFLDRFSKNTQTPNFVKIRPVRKGLFHEEERTDRRTGIMKPIVAFLHFAKAPKNESCRRK